jgi:Zn-dependent protease with chaperone function
MRRRYAEGITTCMGPKKMRWQIDFQCFPHLKNIRDYSVRAATVRRTLTLYRCVLFSRTRSQLRAAGAWRSLLLLHIYVTTSSHHLRFRSAPEVFSKHHFLVWCGAMLLRDGTVALLGILVMPAALSLLPMLLARRPEGTYDAAKWTQYIRWFRVVPLLAVAMWWSLCDTYPQSSLLTSLRNFFPRSVYFLLVPLVSIALARLILYGSSREILTRRWTTIDIFRLAIWSAMARTLPLLMVAIGIDVLPHQPVAGFFYFVGAISVAILATLRLRSAEGFVPRPVNSGELHKRAFFLAKKMGIRLRRVYVFPSGKGHLTNAFGGLSGSIGVSDDYGKWLRGSQLDFVIGHELAHIQQNHTQKKVGTLVALFALVSAAGMALPHLPSQLRGIFPFVAVFAPLTTFYALSRRFEYAADRVGVEIANDPSASVQALAGLYRRTQESPESSRLTELFATHPALSRRVQAIAHSHHLSAERLSHLVRHAF